MRSMIFIDGTWLYLNMTRMAEASGDKDYRIDFSKLPEILGLWSNTFVLRTFLFGSYAVNYDNKDEQIVRRRTEFFNFLRDECGYKVLTYPINFRGRPLRKQERDPNDTFDPKEKCVDISLVSHMLYNAAIPSALDVAIAVLGDKDFFPALKHVRQLGKQVVLVSMKGSCSPELSKPGSEARDNDVIWLDDIHDEIKLRFGYHQIQCESEDHKGTRVFWTTYHPRKGEKYYCEACRKSHSSDDLDDSSDDNKLVTVSESEGGSEKEDKGKDEGDD